MTKNDRFFRVGEASSQGLNLRETRFVDALAEGETHAHAASVAGISERTGRRWLHKPHIAQALRNRIAESRSQARAVLAAGARRAATELVRLAGNARPDSARVAASKAVIEASNTIDELEELDSRLAEVEAALVAGRRAR